MRIPVFVSAFLSIIALSCTPAGQVPPQAPNALRGVENSVRIVVYDGGITWYGDGSMYLYNACNAVYVAPHVLVTSALFLDHKPGIEHVAVKDGERLLTVEAVSGVIEPGLVFIRTKDAGRPVPLVAETPREDVAFSFAGLVRAKPYLQGVPDTFEWMYRPVKRVRASQVARTDGGPVLCGTPVLYGPELAGIVYDEEPSHMRMIPAKEISNALAELSF